MEEPKLSGTPMIGDTAPEFHAVTTQGDIHFPKDYRGSWVVLFSYQSDFTPVCTTEFMTFAAMATEFNELGTRLIGLSIDSHYSHIAWLRKIKELSWKDMKHQEITFPVIADITMEIASKYGMIHPNLCKTQAVRAVYIIDPEGIIRAVLFYPTEIGRNIQEIKRMVTALQKTDVEKVVTPANWNPGEDVILPPPGTCNAATERIEKINENMYSLDWFLCFQQSSQEITNKKTEPEFTPYPSMNNMRNRNGFRR